SRVELAPLEHVELRLADDAALGDVLVGQAAVGEEVLGAVALELDAVRAYGRGLVDQAMGEREIAVVVDPDLGREEARLAGADRAGADLKPHGRRAQRPRREVTRPP